MHTTFLRMSNAHKQDFVNLLYVGYLDTIYNLEPNEIDLFKDLKENVDNKLAKKNPRSNSTTLYKKLQEVLGKILISKGQV
ncbi:hypothetical protein [Sphingobacterium kyonggiense]